MKGEDLEDTPASVYRLFDYDDVLLYVGFSIDPQTRVAFHRYGKPWRREIDKGRTTVTWFPTLGTAADAEVEAILAEGPKYNARVQRAGPSTPEVLRRMRRRTAGYQRCTEPGCAETAARRSETRCPDHGGAATPARMAPFTRPPRTQA